MIISEPRIYLSKGIDAFPNGCPACGDGIVNYAAGDAYHYESWEFGCGSQFVISEDTVLLDVETDCPDATRDAMERCLFVEDE